MWDLASNGSSRLAPPGTESVPEKLAGTETLGWADDFRGSSLPFSWVVRSSWKRVSIGTPPGLLSNFHFGNYYLQLAHPRPGRSSVPFGGAEGKYLPAFLRCDGQAGAMPAVLEGDRDRTGGAEAGEVKGRDRGRSVKVAAVRAALQGRSMRDYKSCGGGVSLIRRIERNLRLEGAFGRGCGFSDRIERRRLLRDAGCSAHRWSSWGSGCAAMPRREHERQGAA
jgi:hypothetical protein